MAKVPTERVLPTGWTPWIEPVMRNFKLACCDCGLVHFIDHRIKDGQVQFRFKRAPRLTARQRRK